MKRKLSILLIITMIVSMFTLGGCGVEVTPIEELEYEYSSSIGGAVITGYKGNSDIVNLPISIDGYIVAGIGESAFEGRAALKEVIIPDSVTDIGYCAFSNCTGLTNIVIPENVTKINSNAFSGCTGLTKITIPDSVTYIGRNAFSGCIGLIEIVVGSGLTEEVGDSAFMGCENVQKIMYDSNLFVHQKMQDSYGIAYGVEEYFFEAFPSLNSVIIGDNVTYIGHGAFLDCRKLTDVTISNSVTTISRNVFYGCPNIVVTYKGEKYTYDNLSELYSKTNNS